MKTDNKTFLKLRARLGDSPGSSDTSIEDGLIDRTITECKNSRVTTIGS